MNRNNFETNKHNLLENLTHFSEQNTNTRPAIIIKLIVNENPTTILKADQFIFDLVVITTVGGFGSVLRASTKTNFLIQPNVI